MFGKARPGGAGSPNQKISVLDIFQNETIEYDSISAAVEALGIKRPVISTYIRKQQKSPYKKRYIFKKV